MTRSLIMSVVCFVMMTVAGPLWSSMAFGRVAIDIPVVLVVYLALSGRQGGFSRASAGPRTGLLDTSGVAAVLIIGYLADLLGGSPTGVYGLALGIVFLFSKAVGRRVFLVGFAAKALVTLAAVLISSFVFIIARWFQGVPPALHQLPIVVGQTIITAFAAPPIMSLLRRIDVRFFGGVGRWASCN